jgi:hypothetical protein
MSIVGINIEIMFSAKPKDVIIPNNTEIGSATHNNETTKYRLLGNRNRSIIVITRTVKIPNTKLSL